MKLTEPKKIYRKTNHLVKSTQRTLGAVQKFSNFPVYFTALTTTGKEKTVIKTRDGLNIKIRSNIWDARILREIFLEKPYIRYFSLPIRPTIVDVGAYIGDFSLYAAKYLNARVIAYEPTPENYSLLKENVELNSLEKQIEIVPKAVGKSGNIVLNVKKNDDEIHVSAYWYSQEEQRSVRSVTLEEIFQIHSIAKIDLLKVDCEGGEYDIFLETPNYLFTSINNIVFEYHRVDGYQEKLSNIINKLGQLGYTIKQHGTIVYAIGTRNSLNVKTKN